MLHADVERRFVSEDLHVEQRPGAAGRSGRMIAGYAAVFNKWSKLMTKDKVKFREIIRLGAFRNALAERQDIRALINHNPSLVIGRTKSGTLRLNEDDRGLRVEIDPPDTQAGRDLMVSMERGDIGEMSFAFTPRKGGLKLNRDASEREVTDADLFDVSVVAYPAYREAEVALRADDRASGEYDRKAANLVRMGLGLRLIESRLRIP